MTAGTPVARLDVSVDVETPEQITFSYAVAGVGSRAAAAAIDMLICVGIWIGCLLSLILSASVGIVLRGTLSSSLSWVLAVFLLVQFVILWGYYVVFEGVRDGQTPGKRIMALRVVRDGGYSVSFGTSAVRNLVRVLDSLPFPLYLVGVVTSLLNKSGKRLGDFVAGTFVIKEGPTLVNTQTVASTVRTADASVRSVVLATQLTDEEYTVLERYINRRQHLAPERRRALAQQLVDQLVKQRSVANDLLTSGSSPSSVLLRLFERERDARASGVASRSDTGARREQHALVVLGTKRWNDFATALGHARQRGFRHMRAEEVSGLVAQYRDVTTDLARLQTASRGRESDALFYVNRVVAQGHNFLYRQPRTATATAVHYLTQAIPREVRRSWRPIGLAAMLLFGPAIASYIVIVRRPAVAALFVSDEMVSRAENGSVREQRGEGYVTIDEAERPIAASVIMTNNVRVAYMAFALGLTAGIGTLAVLVFNGVSVGGGMGVFASKGLAYLLWAFIAPHGVLELTAICLAGGGGFLIAAAMLLPGARTRRQALVENGRRAIALIAGATLLLIVAGTIEGLISPRVWPLSWKLLVSGLTVVALGIYGALGRERDAQPA